MLLIAVMVCHGAAADDRTAITTSGNVPTTPGEEKGMSPIK